MSHKGWIYENGREIRSTRIWNRGRNSGRPRLVRDSCPFSARHSRPVDVSTVTHWTTSCRAASGYSGRPDSRETLFRGTVRSQAASRVVHELPCVPLEPPRLREAYEIITQELATLIIYKILGTADRIMLNYSKRRRTREKERRDHEADWF